MKNILFVVGFALLSLTLVSCSKGKKIDTSKESVMVESSMIQQNAEATKALNIASQIDQEIRRHNINHYPEQTLLLIVNDTAKTSYLVKAAGGKVVYDPNLEIGFQIPFLIVTLPTQKIIDAEFIASLGIRSATLSSTENFKPVPIHREPAGATRDLFVPTQEVNLAKLRARKPGEGLGENITVAVIDTGVDASHPGLKDRMVYWADHTQETRTALNQVKVEGDFVVVNPQVKIPLPQGLDPTAPVYVALINEAAMAAQLEDAEKTASENTAGLDLNKNKLTNDVFPTIVGKHKESGLQVAYINAKGDGKFTEKELSQPIADFNDIRATQACGRKQAPNLPVFLEFPNRTRTIAYPVLIEKNPDHTPAFISLGADFRQHGTHVAGIIAGSNGKFEGVAPKANIMSMKVCSGITCTDAAILRALVDTFYNPYGCVPEVVNISLGASQTYEIDAVDYLIRDLSAKFGTTFVISAGNSGPGYRSTSNLGSSGPAMVVGASISRNAYQKHYAGTPVYPEDALFAFSTVGPSFTGLVRPSIVAPGSALSSITLADGAYEMFNGTSMASPLAAGAAAALLSLAQKTPEYESFAELKKQKLQQIFQKKEGNPITLLQLPLALRASFEETAKRLPNYTDPEQGRGLVNVDGAYDSFLGKLKKLQNKPTLYVDLAINGNNATNRLFDRSQNIATSKDITLTLVPDDEAAESEMLKARSEEIRVRLDYVDVQDNTGKVQKLTQDMPFSIMVPGEATQNGTTANIHLSNSLTQTIKSLRKLDKMEAGKTYVASYSVWLGDERLQTIVDLVQMPLQLGDKTETFDLGSINARPMKRTAAIAKKKQAIAPNEHHRYPIALTARDEKLVVKAGIPSGMNGTLFVSVYDPDGHSIVDTRPFFRRPDMQDPVLELATDIKGKAGIYEVTVSNSSGRWTSATQYDLMLMADRMKLASQKIEIAAGDAASSLPHESILTVLNSSRQATKINADLQDLTFMDNFPAVQVAPGTWTFKKISPPITGETEVPALIIQLGDKTLASPNFGGRVDSMLYTISEDGKNFVPAFAAHPDASDFATKLFPSVIFEAGKPLYLAIETIDLTLNKASVDPTVEVNVFYSGIKVPDGKVKAEVLRDSSQDAFLVKASATEPLGFIPREKAAPRIRGDLVLTTDGPEANSKYLVPVTVHH